MNPAKLNKAIDTGIDNVLNNGLTVKLDIPGETLVQVSFAIIITTAIIMFMSKLFKHKLTL